MSIKNVIKLENVKKKYVLGETGYWALKGISLEVAQGEFIAVVGKSGSGKSTLLNLLGGIDRPTEGKIELNGKELNRLRENQLSRVRGAQIGFVFQFFQLMPTLTVLENVIMPMDFAGKVPASQRRKKAEMLLAKVGISEQAAKFPAMLSGGEQQRVAIARALANEPQIILADEPTGNLDSQTSEAVFQLLQGLTGEGKIVIMVTHNDELAARCQRIVRLKDGMMIEDKSSVQGRG